MELHIVGSNSLGNCYVLQASNEALILEAGVRMAKVKEALRWRLDCVRGCFCTHRHNDHAGYIRQMTECGIHVMALPDVFSSHGLTDKPYTHPIAPNKGYRAGGFKVLPFSVKHDCPCVGFVIDHEEMGRLLFVTDTVTIGVTIPRMNHIMIEANYADDIVQANIESGAMPEAMRPRLLASHMEISQTKAILAENDLSMVDNIVLIHLSTTNSDEARFIREVEQQTGKSVCAATAGKVIDLSLNPY